MGGGPGFSSGLRGKLVRVFDMVVRPVRAAFFPGNTGKAGTGRGGPLAGEAEYDHVAGGGGTMPGVVSGMISRWDRGALSGPGAVVIKDRVVRSTYDDKDPPIRTPATSEEGLVGPPPDLDAGGLASLLEKKLFLGTWSIRLLINSTTGRKHRTTKLLLKNNRVKTIP